MLLVISFFAISTRLLAQVPASNPHSQATSSVQRLDSLQEDARADYSKGDYVSAAKKYERIVSLEPRSAGALNDLGICYHFQGRLHDAVQTLQRALDLDPDILSANLILGIDQLQLNNPEKAVPFLGKALRIDPNNRDAMFALASAHMTQKKFELAADVYKHEVQLRPADADAWYGLGLCFEHLAESTTRRMTGLGKESPYTERIVGEFLTEQDDAIDAEQAFLRALASDDRQEGLHASLGFAHLRSGDLSGADEEFHAERNLHPGNLDARLGAADIAMEQNDFAQARRSLCEVYRTDPGYFRSRLDFVLASVKPETQSQLVDEVSVGEREPDCGAALEEAQRAGSGLQSPEQLKDSFESAAMGPSDLSSLSSGTATAARAERQRGQYSRCFEIIRKNARSNSDDMLLVATCACLSGHFFAGFDAARSLLEHDPVSMPALYWEAESARKLAHQAFQRSVSLAPDSWQGHILLGDIFRQRKQWDQAVSHYKEAARLKPSSPAPLLGLGTVYWQMGQNEEAEAALQQVLKRQADNTSAEFELGEVYLRQRRFQEATPLLERTVAHNPELLSAYVDLGNAYASLGRKKEAISELQRAVSIDRFGDINYHLYRLCKEQGQVRLANQYLAESKRLRALELQNHQQRTERFMEIQKQSSEPDTKNRESVR